MSNFATILLKILTLGLYGRGKSSKQIKRYREDGTLRVEKNIQREGVGALSNSDEILSINNLKNNSDEHSL